MSSNNWVVHGDHTETGMPLLASDPHLGNTLPSSWLLYHLKWTNSDRVVSGPMLAGVPLVAGGRTNHMAYGMTTSRVDTADLWQEKLDDSETKYLVDGEWRDLEVRTEIIKIKRQPDKHF